MVCFLYPTNKRALFGIWTRWTIWFAFWKRRWFYLWQISKEWWWFLEADDNHRVKFNLNVDPDYEDAIGGCKMSLDSMAWGYTYDVDLDDVELTGFLKSCLQKRWYLILGSL
jgi:hypothetical protein